MNAVSFESVTVMLQVLFGIVDIADGRHFDPSGSCWNKHLETCVPGRRRIRETDFATVTLYQVADDLQSETGADANYWVRLARRDEGLEYLILDRWINAASGVAESQNEGSVLAISRYGDAPGGGPLDGFQGIREKVDQDGLEFALVHCGRP